MDFHRQPNIVLFTRYFRPALLERVQTLIQPGVRGLPEKLEKIRVALLYKLVDRCSEFAEFFGIPLRVLIDELGLDDQYKILTIQGQRAIFLFEMLTKEDLVLVDEMKTFLSTLSQQERIELLSHKLAFTMAIREQASYEAPNPITGVSRADLDCCYFIFPDPH